MTAYRWLILFGLLFSSAALATVEYPGMVGLSADDPGKDLAVGSSVTLRIYVDEVLDPDAGWHLSKEGDWVDLGAAMVRPTPIDVAADGNGSTHIDLAAVLAQPGAGKIEEFTIENNTKTVLLQVHGNLGTIGSVLSDEEKETPPQWILPLVPYGGWNQWVIGLAVALVTFLLAYGGFLAYRRLRRSWHKELSYFERANNDLQALAPLIKKQDRASQRLAGYSLARVLREFSHGRFGVSATEMTDQEFIRAVRQVPKLQARLSEIEEIFSHLDLLRYSESAVDPTISAKLHVNIRSFVSAHPPPEEKAKS